MLRGTRCSASLPRKGGGWAVLGPADRVHHQMPQCISVRFCWESRHANQGPPAEEGPAAEAEPPQKRGLPVSRDSRLRGAPGRGLHSGEEQQGCITPAVSGLLSRDERRGDTSVLVVMQHHERDPFFCW